MHGISEDLKKNYHVDVKVFVGDLSLDYNISKVELMIEQMEVDVLINNAWFGITQLFQNEGYCKFQKIRDLHIVCLTRLTKTVLSQMLNKNSGIIISVASDAAYMIAQKNAVYSGTKSYIKQFTEGLHLGLADTNIKVQALCPCLTKTDLQLKMGISKDR